MANTDCNKDVGIITAIEGGKISLHIAQNESCNGCAASSLCEKTSNAGKDLTIVQDNANIFAVGEKVSVNTPQNKVLKAVRLAFMYPVLAVIAFCTLKYFFLNINDTATALICLALICIYFLCLYLNRKKPLFNFSIFITKL
ncbi:MAG: SoxR reducing system RseC family protein [Bacteroidales bacterium]|nr:SoxR reducing system RseC family protein [Bacteroidales bacterium]MBQ7985336.1 SoxR reducing system RseC family protein [Bacteroidales bacterium]